MDKFYGKLNNLTRRARVVLLLDVAIAVLASVISLLLVRWWVRVIPDFQIFMLVVIVASAVFALVSDLIVGTHKIVIRYASFRSISKLLESCTLKDVFFIIIMLLGLCRFDTTESCVIFLCLDFAVSLVLRLVIRIIIVAIFETLNDDMEVNVGLFNVIVYGVSDKSVAMVTRLEQSVHYNVLGFISQNASDSGLVLMDHKIYYAGDEESFGKLKVNLGIQGLLFSSDSDAEEQKDGFVPMALKYGVHILTTPRIEDTRIDGMSTETLRGVTDNDYIPDGMSGFERQAKRIIDLVLSFILIVVFSPLMVICAIAVAWKGGEGPVIYKQERIGRFGRPFYIYKFRTMRQDAEKNGAQLYSGDNDPRLTKVGHFLRVHHLDELPQLFNVFFGDMAFIGYRPERKYYIDKIMEQDPRYYYLYQIRPGVTSYATLRNGYADNMQKMLRRLEFDLYYLRNRSVWFDIKILWQTFVNIAFGKQF